MNRRLAALIRLFTAAFGACVLPACRADITERVTIDGSGAATVSFREALDDDLYRIVREPVSGLDLFATRTFAGSGWAIKRESDSRNRHIFVAAKTCPAPDLETCLSRLPFVSSVHVRERQHDAADPQTQVGAFRNRVGIDMVLGPYGLPAKALQPEFMPRLLNAVASSAIGIYFELALPGTVLDTNGERIPDGAIRWDVDIARPTPLSAEYSVIDRRYLIVAVSLGALLATGLVAWLVQRRS